MSNDSIACSYVLTIEEYKTTQVLARRLLPLKTKLILLGVTLLLWIMFIGIVRDIRFSDSPLTVPVAFSAFMLFALGTWLGSRLLPIRALVSVSAFRKKRACNRVITNAVSESGILQVTTSSEINFNWGGLPKAVESTDGFAIYISPDSIGCIWLPKRAFIRPEEIERCRELIRAKVPKFSII